MSRIKPSLCILTGFSVSVLCLVTLSHFVGFLSSFAAKTSTAGRGILLCVLLDVLLLILFIVQHSLMAGPVTKLKLKKLGLVPVERCLYVGASSVTLLIIISNWSPIPEIYLWNVTEHVILVNVFWWCHLVVWVILFLQTVLVSPLELIGVQQVYNYCCGLPQPEKSFPPPTRLFYHHMRHPGVTCLTLLLWMHPWMTLDRLILACIFTQYLLVGFETSERDFYNLEMTVNKVITLHYK